MQIVLIKRNFSAVSVLVGKIDKRLEETTDRVRVDTDGRVGIIN